MIRWIRLVAACLLAVAVAAGCGGPAPPSPRRGEEIRIAIPAGPASLDPHEVADEVCNSFCLHFFDPLVFLDPNMKVVPWVARSWQNPDPQTWIFTLRDDVRFHDGTLLTADDVAYSLERIRQLPNSPKRPLLVSVETIEVLDPHRIRIVTRTPYMPLLHKLAQVMIVPARHYRGASLEHLRFHPVGSGPYRLARPPSPAEIVLEAAGDGWHEPRPLPRIRFQIVPDDRRRSRMLLEGGADFVKEPDPASFPDLERSGRIRLVANTGIRLIYLGLSYREHLQDGTPNPFRDPEVRRAAAQAVDRAALVAGPLRALAVPARTIVPAPVFGHLPGLSVPGPNPAEARRQLAQARFPGEREFQLHYPAGKYFRIGETAAAVARQLTEAGIRVRPVAVPPAEFARRNFMAEGYDLFLAGWIPVSGDASDYSDHCFYTRGKMPGYGGFNYTGYSDPELDRLIEASAAESQRDKRLAMLQQILVRVTGDLVWVPLVFLKDTSAFRNDLMWQPRVDRYLLAFQLQRIEP